MATAAAAPGLFAGATAAGCADRDLAAIVGYAIQLAWAVLYSRVPRHGAH
jgi:hypothetical protein